MLFSGKNNSLKMLLPIILACGIVAVLGSTRTIVDRNANWRIVGGKVAKDGQFPYQVYVMRKHLVLCGGSILNKRWILTAAHCMYGATPSQITVTAGTNQFWHGGITYNASEVVWHKKYPHGKSTVNDIALVKVDRDIALGPKISAIPIEKGNVSVGTNATLSGWGMTKFPGSVSNKLQYINLTIISNAECHAYWPGVKETHICTFTKKGEGACQGDSGSPLVANGKQVGVVSFGIPCGRGHPDGYTKVSPYASWIESTIAL